MTTVNPEKESVNPAREEFARLYQIFGRVVFLVLPRGAKVLKTKAGKKSLLRTPKSLLTSGGWFAR